MATYTIIKLKNLSPLHIGTGKENYDSSSSNLHSDTLSAALAAMRVQKGKVDDIKDFLSSFVISSAFPFSRSLYFLPKAHGKIKVIIEGREEYKYRKKLKKLQFIELSLWKRLLNGETITIKEEQIQKEFLLPPSYDLEPIYKSKVNQRVTVPRGDGQDAEPFFFEWNFFDVNAGLYCITDASGALLNEIISLFNDLGEAGLGTDKNVGGGKFNVEVDEKQVTIENNNANAIMLLSLYIPSEEEMESLKLSQSKYELLLRNGYIAGSQEETLRHLRKKSVYMFGVGSVLHTQRKLSGKIVDLRPEWNEKQMHAVFRSGKPLYVPIKID